MSDYIKGKGLTYSEALDHMKRGRKMRRSGWNGKGMHIAITKNGYIHSDEADAIPLIPFIYMFTAQGEYVPWLCSQTDAIAEDWEIVENE